MPDPLIPPLAALAAGLVLVRFVPFGARELTWAIGVLAVLALLAKSVVAVEQDADLARVASDRLSAVGAANATVVQNALVEGAQAGSPYDVIVVEGGIEEAPQTLLSQLGEGGRLVAVLQQGAHGRAHLFVRENGRIGSRPDFDASVPVLVGFRKTVGFVF